MVLAALFAAMLHSQQRSIIIARPIHLCNGPVLGLTLADEDGQPVDPRNPIYFGFRPHMIYESPMVEEICELLKAMSRLATLSA